MIGIPSVNADTFGIHRAQPLRDPYFLHLSKHGSSPRLPAMAKAAEYNCGGVHLVVGDSSEQRIKPYGDRSSWEFSRIREMQYLVHVVSCLLWHYQPLGHSYVPDTHHGTSVTDHIKLSRALYPRLYQTSKQRIIHAAVVDVVPNDAERQ